MQQAADWLDAGSMKQPQPAGLQLLACMQQATAHLGILPAVELTQGTEHGPPSVDELDLAVAGEGLGVSRQTSCVPAIVTGELAIQVVRRAGEGAQKLGPLCRAMVKTCVSQMWFKSGSSPAQAAAGC